MKALLIVIFAKRNETKAAQIISLPQTNLPSKMKAVSNDKTKILYKKFDILYEMNLGCLCGKRCCIPITVHVVDSKTIAFDLTNMSSHYEDLTILVV